mmetsp:Transcript_96758/g.282890  ORF Transcript_96758/g.282890 Transcript_96758/m.282890 type:complete len:197 (-) Transcript_96758:97-687(-)
MRPPRLAEVLRRLKLPPEASQAELRKAYYKQAKSLHPDIAGPGSAEEFRQLKQDYEEAVRLMRDGEGPSSYPGAGPHPGGPGDAQWQTPSGQTWERGGFYSQFYGKGGFKEETVDFDPRAFRARSRSHAQRDSQGGYSYAASGNFSASSSQARAEEPLTPAQRLRFLAFVSGSFLAGGVFISRLRRNATTIHVSYT